MDILVGQCNHKGLYMREQEGQSERRRDCRTGGQNNESQGIQVNSRSWKIQVNRFSSRASKRNTTLLTYFILLTFRTVDNKSVLS